MVRLVDHKVVVRRQGVAAGCGPGQQQRVVDDNDVRGLRLAACPLQEAGAIGNVRAAVRRALQVVGAQAVPDRLLGAGQPQFGAVPGLRTAEPDQNARGEQRFGVGGERLVAEGIKLAEAEVVAAALQLAGPQAGVRGRKASATQYRVVGRRAGRLRAVGAVCRH